MLILVLKGLICFHLCMNHSLNNSKAFARVITNNEPSWPMFNMGLKGL